MKVLQPSFIRKGFEHNLIERTDKAAIYSQSFDGKILAFEVFRVKILKPYTLAGIEFPESEPYPHDEAFGLWAWSVAVFSNQERAFQRARDKYTQLNQTQDGTQEA